MVKAHHSSTDRAYREFVAPRSGEVRFPVCVEQTDLLIVAETDLRHAVAAHVTQVRGILKNWILLHPDFAESLVPVDVPHSAPPIIRHMAAAAAMCNVGPMAAVAGAVAQAVGDHFAGQSPNFLVENGGDTYLCSTRDRVVALLAEPDTGAMVGLKVAADRFPMAICSSSATIGHSLSLGSGDLVSVLAPDACLADAAATALCNELRTAADLDRVLAKAESWSPHGLCGVFAQHGGALGAWGDIELTALE